MSVESESLPTNLCLTSTNIVSKAYQFGFETMGGYRSTKLFRGYSCCFRQWRAAHSHCRFLHGYALQFQVVFSGELDENNWVCDFGGFGRNGIKSFLSFYFDHTTLLSKDDPHRPMFEEMERAGLIQLRVLDGVSIEYFSRFVWENISQVLQEDPMTKDRVSVVSVTCIENENNTAIYLPVSHRLLT